MAGEVKRSKYKGYPVIEIPTGEYDGEPQYMTLGYKKAKAVVDNIEEIELFCIDCEQHRSRK